MSKITHVHHHETFTVGDMVKFFGDDSLGPFRIEKTYDIPTHDEFEPDVNPQHGVGHHQWVEVIGGDWGDTELHKYSGAYFHKVPTNG